MDKKKAISTNKIGFWSAVVVGINAMIGVGVLTIPTVLSEQVGPAGLLTCLFSIFFILCIGLSLARTADIYPGQGWNYLYPSKWAGHKVGLFSAFSYIFAILIAMGLLVQQAGVWCNQFISFISPKTLSIIIFLLLMLLVIAGAQASSWSQYVIAFFVVVPLLLTGIFCWFHFDANLVTPFMPHGSLSVFKATSTVLFALFGFESIASLYPVVQNPQKNVPKAFITAILVVGTLYIVFFYGVLFAIPAKYFSAGLEEPLSSILARFFPAYRFLSFFVLIGAVFGILGTIHSMLWSISELFTSILKKTKSKFIHTLFKQNLWNEKIAVIFSSFFIFLSFLFLKPNVFFPITALLIIPSYVLSIAALLFIKKEWKSWRNIITLLGLIGGGLVLYFAGHMTYLAIF